MAGVQRVLLGLAGARAGETTAEVVATPGALGDRQRREDPEPLERVIAVAPDPEHPAAAVGARRTSRTLSSKVPPLRESIRRRTTRAARRAGKHEQDGTDGVEQPLPQRHLRLVRRAEGDRGMPVRSSRQDRALGRRGSGASAPDASLGAGDGLARRRLASPWPARAPGGPCSRSMSSASSACSARIETRLSATERKPVVDRGDPASRRRGRRPRRRPARAATASARGSARMPISPLGRAGDDAAWPRPTRPAGRRRPARPAGARRPSVVAPCRLWPVTSGSRPTCARRRRGHRT